MQFLTSNAYKFYLFFLDSMYLSSELALLSNNTSLFSSLVR